MMRDSLLVGDTHGHGSDSRSLTENTKGVRCPQSVTAYAGFGFQEVFERYPSQRLEYCLLHCNSNCPNCIGLCESQMDMCSSRRLSCVWAPLSEWPAKPDLNLLNYNFKPLR